MSNKKTFSTRIDAERLKALKHLAVDEDKSIGVLLEEAERLKALKHLAVDEDKSIGVLLEEAIDELIKKYEKEVIKPLA